MYYIMTWRDRERERAMYCISYIIIKLILKYSVCITDDRYFKMKHCDIVTKFICAYTTTTV